jgi:glycine/D-amino acid oxidase-like deaminating enzyme
MGQYMLQRIQQHGGKRLSAHLKSIVQKQKFELEVERSDGNERISADVIVNAAGPFAKDIAAMIGVDLPLKNVFQQKLAFDDKHNAISRQQLFSLDLDDQELDWTAEERDLLAEDPDLVWLLKPILGGAHCRPEGGDKRTWVKLGWAFNRESSEPQQEYTNDPHFNPQFPELILRAASRLNPSLKQYCESFPDRWTHYGGYYPMTNENWPLVGPLGVDGAFITGALSGYGCMAACAAGSLCASWIADGDLPDYASQLSLARYDDCNLMAEIMNSPSKGIL